jgi:hypothetical protein
MSETAPPHRPSTIGDIDTRRDRTTARDVAARADAEHPPGMGSRALSHLSRLGNLRLVPPLRIAVVAVLAASALSLLIFVYHFALTRFFTIDEYQWGHATWLVSEGKVPYRDFYEHHLPLGYLVHSLLLSDGSSFTERALLLRKIAFAYILLAASVLAIAAYLGRRDPYEALLLVIAPIACGFGLMSAIDYRGDNWSAFTLLCCFAVLEMNQTARRPWLAATAGVLFSVAILMTQKAMLLGGLAVALMLPLSVWHRLSSRPPRWLSRLSAQRIDCPGSFCVAAALPVAALFVLGARVGALDQAVQIVFVESLQHERLYPGFSAWKYFEPYLRYAPWTSGMLAAGATFYLIRGRERFWALPTLAVILGGMGIKAPFPYNFVLGSVLVGICAVKGYCEAVRWSAQRWPRLTGALPLLYLLPLSTVLPQLGFVEGMTTNAEQLETLRQIEAHSTPEDVVIDSEGSALFRPHRGYYWYQGAAHVKMFEDYYEGDFVFDLRASEALFWINGFRTRQLPASARRYLSEHYTPFRGDLFVLGLAIPGNASDHAIEMQIDVVRAGEYHLSRPGAQADRALPSVADHELRVDGELVQGNRLQLDVGWHRLWVSAGTPEYRLTFLPPLGLDDARPIGRHAPLFEYGRWR